MTRITNDVVPTITSVILIPIVVLGEDAIVGCVGLVHLLPTGMIIKLVVQTLVVRLVEQDAETSVEV